MTCIALHLAPRRSGLRIQPSLATKWQRGHRTEKGKRWNEDGWSRVEKGVSGWKDCSSRVAVVAGRACGRGRRAHGARVGRHGAVAGHRRHAHLAADGLEYLRAGPRSVLIRGPTGQRRTLRSFLRAPSAPTPLPSRPASSSMTISFQCECSKLGVYLCRRSERSQAGMSPRRVRSIASSGFEPEPAAEGMFVFELPPGERSVAERGERRGEPMPPARRGKVSGSTT